MSDEIHENHSKSHLKAAVPVDVVYEKNCKHSVRYNGATDGDAKLISSIYLSNALITLLGFLPSRPPEKLRIIVRFVEVRE